MGITQPWVASGEVPWDTWPNRRYPERHPSTFVLPAFNQKSKRAHMEKEPAELSPGNQMCCESVFQKEPILLVKMTGLPSRGPTASIKPIDRKSTRLNSSHL